MALKDRLKTLRIKSGLSQRALAERLHFGSGAIGNYESGLRVPDADTMNALAEFFNVPVADLAFGPQLTPAQYAAFNDKVLDALAHTSSDDLAVMEIDEYYIRMALRRRDPIREDRARQLLGCFGISLDAIMETKTDQYFEAPENDFAYALAELMRAAREATDEEIAETKRYLDYLRSRGK